jgi:RNA methyltransferase, TrmH family
VKICVIFIGKAFVFLFFIVYSLLRIELKEIMYTYCRQNGLKIGGILMNRIESPKNNKIKEWKKLFTKKGREEFKKFLLEGPHLIDEALKKKIHITDIIVSDGYQLPEIWDLTNINTWFVSERVMKELANTQQPQGIIAVSPLLNSQLEINTNGKYVLLDGVQDPGNLGTIIRTADSAGFDGVILGEGTVDLYNSKVIRSTQGSLFHLPVVTGDLGEWLEILNQKKIPVFGTALKGATSFYEVEREEGLAIILGNEGNGVQPKFLNQTTQNVYIPIYGQAESLNVAIAAGILFYGLAKHK